MSTPSHFKKNRQWRDQMHLRRRRWWRHFTLQMPKRPPTLAATDNRPTFPIRLLRRALQPIVWLGKLGFYTLDLAGLPEFTENFWQLTKSKSRPLNAIELAEAQKVFGESIPYRYIRIDENALIARLGARLQNSPQMGVSTFFTINFTRSIVAAPGNSDMAWLIHELVHVAQMFHAGSTYIPEAIYAQYTPEGYDYGFPQQLVYTPFAHFNREQQGRIIEHYYYYVLYNRPHPTYSKLPAELFERFAGELRAGLL